VSANDRRIRNAFLVIEGLPPVDELLVERAIDDLAALVRTYCGGTVTTGMLNRSQPEIALRVEE
jgi:DNA/RNA-binding domain of Phe-tRNA-synthetase-like protein